MSGDALREQRERIARRAVLELRPGQVVNLGVGIPLMILEFVPPDLPVFLHSETGIVGMGPPAAPGEEDPDLIDAGAQRVTAIRGASFFDTITSATIMRGGHLDAVFMGAYQVDELGNIANWSVRSDRITGGVGGAMDLAAGASRLIALMTHTTRDGRPRLLERCDMPLTALGAVDRIITELAVIDVDPRGLVVRELLGELALDEVQDRTGARLTFEPAGGEGHA
jgi:3-oxoacid CoA-transferase B subunit